MPRLSGKHCIVTGAARGIGRGIAARFAELGATVIACGRTPPLGSLPDGVTWHSLDVTNTAAIAALAKDIGPIDVLVNNAGVQVEKTLVQSTDDDWDLVMNVNAKGVFAMCRAFIPQMRDRGSIINIGSVSGNAADPSMALYNASKAFVHGLTRSIAVDHGPGVRCNAICPGWIETGMLDAAFDMAKDPQAARRDALSRHPTRRFGTPADVAAMAVWLASDDSSFATGQCYVVDGGLTAASPLQPSLF